MHNSADTQAQKIQDTMQLCLVVLSTCYVEGRWRTSNRVGQQAYQHEARLDGDCRRRLGPAGGPLLGLSHSVTLIR